MSEHTPGPWRQSHRQKPNGMYATQIYDADGETIADIAWYPIEVADGWVTAREANARLISAAPDMLEALQDLSEAIGRWCDWGDAPSVSTLDDWLSRIDATIAKATGRED